MTSKEFDSDYVKVALWGEFYVTDIEHGNRIGSLLTDTHGNIQMLGNIATGKLSNGMG